MGHVIVIDGLDGCGKTTQHERINTILQNEYPNKVKPFSYPNYDSGSSEPIKMYLSGKISQNMDDINPYATSMFYSVDRYIGYLTEWKKYHDDDYHILLARYTSSNLIHQMSKLPQTDWDKYIDWLYGIEMGKFGLPEESKIIFLSMDINISQKYLTSRYSGDESKKDIHESNIEYLMKCHDAAMYIANKYPEKWTIVKCDDGDKILSIDDITYKILSALKSILDIDLSLIKTMLKTQEE